GALAMGFAGVLLVWGALLDTMAGAAPGGGAFSVNVGGLQTAARNLVISLVGAIAVIAVFMRYMKHVPGFNRMVLDKAIAEGPALDRVSGGGAAVVAEDRVGETGVATTDLRPSGKGMFGNDYLDVVSDGDFISQGASLRILAHEGSRIVVTEIPG
ncbi:MAG: NfeD family protein, partial [Verrucomicrobiota bacterium]